MDEASALPYDQNVGATVAVARWCHERAVTEREGARGVDPVVAGDCNPDVLVAAMAGGLGGQRSPPCPR